MTVTIFHQSLSDSQSPQVSRNFINILADLNNVVVWMVPTRPPTSNYPNPFIDPLVTVHRASITIGINVTFMFHSFFNSLLRSRCLSFFSLSFKLTVWSAILLVLFFLLIIIRFCRLTEIR